MLNRLLKVVLFSSSLLLATVASANTIDSLLRDKNDPVGGNPKGTVTVVEFFDYQCSHCASMAYVLDAAIKKNPNLRVVYKEFPIRGRMSQLASQAALAANIQGKYHTMNRSMLHSRGINESQVVNLANKANLDITKLKQDMHSKQVIHQLNNNYALGRALRLSGTPALFIAKTNATSNRDVTYVLGELTPYELQSAIDKTARQ